jgi:hypothetical protein
MLRAALAFLLAAVIACAATVKLYLKDGEYQLVREYQVLSDRVRFYSVERGQWEEIPLTLVDLKRTESEQNEHDQTMKQEAAEQAAEDKAEREAADEVARVPVETGVYLVAGNQLKTIKPAESKVVGNKKRTVLKVLSPIPMVSGKGTLEVDGEHSPNVVDSATPEFYIRLSAEERFGIIRAAPGKNSRIMEKFEIIPVSKEIVEQPDEVQIFRHQVGGGLYKIWPMQPLAPGEYAVVEYTPATNGAINMQIWDFGVPAGVKGVDAPAKKQ